MGFRLFPVHFACRTTSQTYHSRQQLNECHGTPRSCDTRGPADPKRRHDLLTSHCLPKTFGQTHAVLPTHQRRRVDVLHGVAPPGVQLCGGVADLARDAVSERPRAAHARRVQSARQRRVHHVHVERRRT